MHPSVPRPVVHLELHTGDQARANAFYSKLLCWRPQLIEAGAGSYLALELGGGFGGGIVECGTARPLWQPYVEVGQIEECTEHARRLGASVLLAPREGPTGWHSIVSAPDGGELGGPLAGATRWRLVRARASGQLAFGAYAWDEKAQTFTPHAVIVLTLRGAQIQEVTAFLTPGAFPSFGLPAAVLADS